MHWDPEAAKPHVEQSWSALFYAGKDPQATVLLPSMAAVGTCPRCGGDQIRRIAPNYYECVGEIAVGGIPASATGLPHDIPDLRVCGERFQVGSSGATPSCALCGLDSIGTCEGCRRRLCGRHGTTSPPFLCKACFETRIAERQRREAESKAHARVEATLRRNALREQLLASGDHMQIARILSDDADILTASEAKKVWESLLSLDRLPATHELVTVVGKGTLGGYFLSRGGLYGQRGSWKEAGVRSELWFAEKSVRVFSKGFDGQSDRWIEGCDGVLSADGSFWRAVEGVFLGLSDGREASFMLPKGRRVQLSKRPTSTRSWGVEAGYALIPNDDPLSYVRTVATVAGGGADRLA